MAHTKPYIEKAVCLSAVATLTRDHISTLRVPHFQVDVSSRVGSWLGIWSAHNCNRGLVCPQLERGRYPGRLTVSSKEECMPTNGTTREDEVPASHSRRVIGTDLISMHACSTITLSFNRFASQAMPLRVNSRCERCRRMSHTA